jgi:Flp pilus assembly protein TadG
VKNERGTALVESAISLLMFFTILFGILEAGRFMFFQQTLTDAAREGARLAVAPITQTDTMATCDQIKTYVTQVTNIAHISNPTIDCTPVVVNTGGVATHFTQVTVSAPYNVVTLAMFSSSLNVTLKGQALMRNETSP